MRHVIAGMGEVGKGLYRVLSEQELHKDVYAEDVNMSGDEEWAWRAQEVDVLHICFPFVSDFGYQVLEAINTCKPKKLVVIHSTVEIGTTRKIIEKAEDVHVVHSPVRGTHPEMATGLRSFVKYIGADSDEAYELAAQAMRIMPCKRMSSPEASELAKLLSLARYGLNISFAKEQDELCEKHGLTYSSVVQDWEMSYNEGLLLQGRTEYVRPLLTPPRGKIGGHCVVPAMEKVADKSRLIKEALMVAEGENEVVEDDDGNDRDEIAPVDSGFEVGEGTKIWNFVNILNGAKIGRNCVIGSYVEIGRNVVIGDDCKIEAGAYIPEGVKIGNRVFVGPNVVFTNDRFPRVGEDWNLEETFVEDGVSIGANCTVRCGVRIKSGAIVGCGSVVTKSVGPGGIWFGNPAEKVVSAGKR